MRDVAIRKSHLAHFCFGNFQHGIIRQRIGWEEGQPILISLRGLNQSTRGSFEKERIGDGKFSQRQEGRIGIGVNNSCKQQSASIETPFSNFLGSFLKQHSITTSNRGSGKLRIFVVVAAPKETKE